MLPALPLMVLLTHMAPAPVAAAPGEAVVRAAYSAGGKKWFRNAQWVQRTRIIDERRVETWYVAVQPPGLMRVDVAPGVTGRALIYRNDSTYSFGKGQLKSSVQEVQPLSVLLHDLHSADPDKTIAMLKKFGFDLTRTHERMWEGDKVIVVGAFANDTSRNQFWLDKKRLVLVRLIEGNGADPRRPLDARVSGYEKAGGGWIGRNIKIYLGRDLIRVEDYSSVKIDAKLEPGLFEPLPYHLPQWVNGAQDIFGGIPNVPIPAGRGRGG